MSETQMEPNAWRALVSEAALEPDLPIIDAHHHIWPEPIGEMETYPPEQLFADKAGSGHNIVATVFMEAHARYFAEGPEHLRPVGETVYAAENGERADRMGGKTAGLCAGIVGHANLMLGAAVSEVLDAHIAAAPKRFRGIRHMTAYDEVFPFLPGVQAGMMATAEFHAGVAQVQKRGLSLDVFVLHPQLGEVAALAAAFPGLTFILNHIGTPLGLGRYANKSEADFSAWETGMAKVAACSNVVAKIGGLNMGFTSITAPTSGPKPWSSAQMADAQRRHVLKVIELFGPSRCMFESNFPVDRMAGSMTVTWNAFKRMTADFSAAEKAEMYAGTASRVYRLGI
jgi:L-fuconolactonase